MNYVCIHCNKKHRDRMIKEYFILKEKIINMIICRVFAKLEEVQTKTFYITYNFNKYHNF